MDRHPTGTVTFLFTDIEGSTKLAREHPEAWDDAQRRHHKILQEAIESEGGFVFQIIGDAFCAAFHKAGEALKAAVKAQQALQSEPWGSCLIRVRMGIHTGEAKLHQNEYQGYLTLSLIQRIMSAGHGGQVLISDPARNSLHGELPENTDLQDRGRLQFKGFPDPLRVFQVLAPGLPTDFPPLKALNIRPTNLPIQLTSFVGREKELADVKRLVQDSPMLTLIGPGGTGKTRLSIHAGNELLDQYPDGVWLVELAPILDPAFVPRTTAITLGLRDEPQRPVIDMLCDYLRDKKMLILFDNCEHLVDACARMANRALRTAQDVRILATSREALGIGGEVTYRVPSLGLPDLDHLPPLESLSQYEAVKLFIDRATAVVPTFTVTNSNAPALAQICHHLDGIPLAIELAAAKVHVLSLKQISKRLDDRFRLLTGGSRTVLERHQTLRAAIDWSYNLLPAAEQMLFRRLSTFVGGWTLEAAESVCADELLKSEEILSLLEHLINKSLVIMQETHGETRYSMLETLKRYANEKLIELGESNVLRDRHLEYFLNLAETAAPYLIRTEQIEWLPVLDADYENLRGALEWALIKEPAEPSLNLCWTLGWYWEIRCYGMEGLNWLKKALNKPSAEASRSEKLARARALYTRAHFESQLASMEQVLSSADSSMALALEAGGKEDVAIARFYFVMANSWREENYDHTSPLLEQSFAEFQELAEPFWQTRVFFELGQNLTLQNKLTDRESREKMVELARKAGERLSLAQALFLYAYSLLQLNQLEQAKAYAEESDLLLRQIGSENSSVSSQLLAEIAMLNGDYQMAKALCISQRDRLRLLGDKFWTAMSLTILGWIAVEEEDLHQAQTYLEESLAILREAGNEVHIAYRLVDLATVYYLEGNLQGFKQNFKELLNFKHGFNQVLKVLVLSRLLNSLYRQDPVKSAYLLGVLNRYEQQASLPLDPHDKQFFIRVEANARHSLGDSEFEMEFAKGQELSLDQAFDLVMKEVENF